MRSPSPLLLLEFLGRNARIILALGCLSAFFLPALSTAVRPALPFLVMLVLGLAIMRIEPVEIAKAFSRPRTLLFAVLVTILMMPVTGLVYLGLAKATGLGADETSMLVFLAATPPIASTASLCFILGFDARIGLITTLVATALTPLIGPVMVAALLPETLSLSPFQLGKNLALMVIGSAVLAVVFRLTLGARRISENGLAIDGVSAVAMVLFILPLFDGVGETITAKPTYAVWILVLCLVFNLGINACASRVAGLWSGAPIAGALGLMWGNRTIAIYLAILPYDRNFSLFVALYQVPMYLTPMVWEAARSGLRRDRDVKD